MPKKTPLPAHQPTSACVTDMSLDRLSFAAALKMHRTRLGLTQAEAANILDVSPRALWKWENNAGDTLAVTMEGVIDRLKIAKAKTPPTAPRPQR